MKSLFLGHQNLVRYLIDYYEYRTYDNEHIGYEWTKITNDDFNYLRMKDYYNLRSLRGAGLVNTSTTSKTSTYKQHYPVDNLKRPTQQNYEPSRSDTIVPLCNNN